MASTEKQSPCDTPSDIRGSIVTITQGTSSTMLGGFLLDGTYEQNVQFDKVFTKIGPDTLIFEKQGQECRTSSFSVLKVGQRVQVQSNGVTALSYPPQITATEIVILLAHPSSLEQVS